MFIYFQIKDYWGDLKWFKVKYVSKWLCDKNIKLLTLIVHLLEVPGHSLGQLDLCLAGEVHKGREEGCGSDLHVIYEH